MHWLAGDNGRLAAHGPGSLRTVILVGQLRATFVIGHHDAKNVADTKFAFRFSLRYWASGSGTTSPVLKIVAP